MLVAITEPGATAYCRVIERQECWTDDLVVGLTSEAIEAASVFLRTLQRRLDRSAERNSAAAMAAM